MKNSIVLFSGGLDSTICLYRALLDPETSNVLAVTFNYGQKNSKEISAAFSIIHELEKAYKNKLTFKVLDMSYLFTQYNQQSALNNTSYDKEVQTEDYFVPGRNIQFLLSAATLGYSIFGKGSYELVIGNSGEGDSETFSGYPDSRDSTMILMESLLNAAFYNSWQDELTQLYKGKEDLPSQVFDYSNRRIHVDSNIIKIAYPIANITKAEAINSISSYPLAKTLLNLSYTCYENVEGGCGCCPACKLRHKAENQSFLNL